MKTIEEQEFEFTVWSLTGRDTPSIDRFLVDNEGTDIWKSDQGTENRSHLEELRTEAFHAYTADDMALMKAKIDALFLYAEYIGYRFAAHPKAVQGVKFTNGRKSGSVSPIRNAIAKLLKNNPRMKNEDLRITIAKKPPKGWEFHDNRAGKYFDGPNNKNMNYERFCNVASEERRKLKD